MNWFADDAGYWWNLDKATMVLNSQRPADRRPEPTSIAFTGSAAIADERTSDPNPASQPNSTPKE